MISDAGLRSIERGLTNLGMSIERAAQTLAAPNGTKPSSGFKKFIDSVIAEADRQMRESKKSDASTG
jgi:hypothetical protein